MQKVSHLDISWKAVRAAVTAGSIAGLTLLAACADSNTSAITAPAAPRNATLTTGTSGHGKGNAGMISLCVDASSPAGTYKFRNSSWNSGLALPGYGVQLSGTWYDQGDGGEAYGAAGGTTVWYPAEGDNSEYVVAVGSCVLVVDRSKPSDHYQVDMIDDWQAVNLSISTIPAGVQYHHTDCEGDVGVVAPQPTPCGNNNSPTRAFANYDHGTKVKFFFTAAPPSNGVIAPTATTCEDYAKGNAPRLGEVFVGFKSNKISNLAPGVFFYYATVTKGAGQAVSFSQTISPNAGGLPAYGVMQTQAYLYKVNGSSCTTVATLPLTNGGIAGSGGASLAAGTYVLGVKFATDAAKGTTVNNAALQVSGALLSSHNYVASVNGVQYPNTGASIDTKTK